MKDELARLESSRELPAQLSARPNANQRAAAAWLSQEVISDIAAQLDRLNASPRTWRNEVARAQALALRKESRRWREPLLEFALGANDEPAEIVFENGIVTDALLLQALRVTQELELWLACDRAAADDPAGAQRSLENALRIAAATGAAPQLDARLAAADMRRRSLDAFTPVLLTSGNEENYRLARRLLRDQLADWTSDAMAWRGERARGLCLCELIVRGQLATVLSTAEHFAWRSRVDVAQIECADPAQATAAAGEYLQGMREMIAACDAPCEDRLAIVRRAGGAAARRNAGNPFGREASIVDPHFTGDVVSPPQPNFAQREITRILLADCEQAHTLQILDRARCEAWSWALALALEESPGSVPPDPFTNQPFAFECDDESIRVTLAKGASFAETISLPRRAIARHIAESPSVHYER